MKSKNRGKIIGLLCFGVIFLCTSGVWAAKSNFIQKILPQKNKSKENLALFDISNLDSDSDGLSDKKEQELGTNLYNSDSDSDGYSDLEEVKTGHDPLKVESTKLVDEDGDGLTGEDEKKYGTNPKNPDTDFDGYLDGEEIISGHDPLLADFSSFSAAFKNLAQANEITESKPNAASGCQSGSCSASNSSFSSLSSLASTEIDRVFSNLSPSLPQNLENLANTQDISDLQSNLFATVGLDRSKFSFDKKVNLPEIPQEEIKISKDTSREAIQEYFNILGIILYKNSPVQDVNEIEEFAQGINLADSRQIENFLEIVGKIESTLKVMEVPEKQELIDFHKKVIATATYLESLLMSLKNIDFQNADSIYSFTNLLPKFVGVNEFVFSELVPEAEKKAADFGVKLPDRNFLEKYSNK